MIPRITLQTLKEIPEGELGEFIWDFYLEHIMSHEPKTNRRKFELSLPRGFRITKSAVVFRSEMDNGGIQQYITNHTCTPIADPERLAESNSEALADVKACIEALRLIGATESAGLLTEALALYERHGWPFGPDDRWLEFTPQDESICDRIDYRWFHPEGDELSYSRDWRLQERYLREHLDECVIE